MNLQSAKLIAETICLLVVAGSAVYVVQDLHQTQIQARAFIATSGQDEKATFEIVNRPCDTKDQNGKLVPCGTLAEVGRTAVKVQDIAVTTQRQVQQSATLVNTASSSLQTTATSIGRVADASTALLVSARGTTDSLPPLVGDLRTDLEHLTPVEDTLAMDAKDFDALLKDDAIHQTLSDVQGMADSGNHILFDFRRVADHETEQFLKPVRWYMQPVKKGSELIDITAAIARHTP